MVRRAEPVELAADGINRKVMVVFKPPGVDLELLFGVTGGAVQDHPITRFEALPPHPHEVF